MAGITKGVRLPYTYKVVENGFMKEGWKSRRTGRFLDESLDDQATGGRPACGLCSIRTVHSDVL